MFLCRECTGAGRSSGVARLPFENGESPDPQRKPLREGLCGVSEGVKSPRVDGVQSRPGQVSRPLSPPLLVDALVTTPPTTTDTPGAGSVGDSLRRPATRVPGSGGVVSCVGPGTMITSVVYLGCESFVGLLL